jgi:hypothetical protein
MEGQVQSPKLLEQVRNVLRLHHVSTTMIYTHVLRQCGRGTKSPLDCQ